MDLPRSSSDIRIATACQICNGNGGFGPRTRVTDGKGSAGFSPCTTCNGTGWKLYSIPEIPPDLARKIMDKLAASQAKPDPAKTA